MYKITSVIISFLPNNISQLPTKYFELTICNRKLKKFNILKLFLILKIQKFFCIFLAVIFEKIHNKSVRCLICFFTSKKTYNDILMTYYVSFQKSHI